MLYIPVFITYELHTMKKIYLQTILSVVATAITLSASAIDFTAQGEYAGSSDCRPCHEKFYELWSTSHHGTAMQAFSGALARTLEPMKEPLRIGNVNFIIELNNSGGVLRETHDDGTEKTYPIRHALGGRNVFFFLVPLEKGKLQTAPIAYYVYGKKWYNSTGSMVRHFSDGTQDAPLDWTDRQLTFNTACHDCHVSQLERNYNPADDSYQTTWKEPGINCETCHGPAEEHIRAAEAAEARGEELKPEDMNLVRFHEDLTRSQRDATCAPCHAKMVPLTTAFTPGEEFFNHYDLMSYEDRDFYPDGRDLGENYTQTGWMINPCAESGQLECIHCHTSSGRFRFKDNPNQACMPCHEHRLKNVAEHSHHEEGTPGSTCVSCHMPITAQAYMTRSDHSFRPPSPAASLEFGSPNACNLCHNNKEAIRGEFYGHQEKDMKWADEFVKKWHGEDSGKNILKLGRIITACRENDWTNLPEILAFLDEPACDQAAKVAILRMLTTCPSEEKWPAIRKQLASDKPWVRSAAAASLEYDMDPASTQLLLNAATDEFRTVRIRAASALIHRDLSGYSSEQRNAFDAANKEYWNSLIIWPDRWSSHYNQGLYYDRIGNATNALSAYTKAMELRSDVIQPIINASMVHARSGDSMSAYGLLQKAVKIEPANSMVNFNIALLEAEFKNMDACEKYLRAALAADPLMAQAAYNLGILLCQAKKDEGFDWLKKAAELAPSNWTYLSSYIFFLNQSGKSDRIEGALKQAIGTGQAAPNTYVALAQQYQNSGRTADAIEIYKKMKLNKQFPEDARQYAARMERQLRQQ